VKDNLARVLLQSARDVPDREAIILQQGDDELALSFKELVEGSARVAAALNRFGVKPGEPVILILEHGRALVECFFGAILHGSIPAIMPFLTEKLSPARYRESLQTLISISQPAALVTYPEFEHECRSAVEAGSSVRAILLSSDVLEEDVPAAPEFAGLERSPDDLVFLQHSSGTTGLQKGVALSHQAVLNQIECYQDALQMTSGDVVVSWLPLYHDMGLIAGFIMPVMLRSKLVLMSPFEWVRAPQRLLRAVSNHQGTLSWLPNFAYNFCSQKIRARDIEGVDLASWRAVINCSEPTRLDSHEQFYQRFKEYGLRREALTTCYAMAENVFAVTQSEMGTSVRVDRVDRELLQREGRAVPIQHGDRALSLLSAGKPIRNTQVQILNEVGNRVAERTIGEIALQGDCLLSSYYHREDLTQSAFLNGWYLTGDLGYLADGELFVTGRRKEIIIVGGKNIYPQDLEYLVGSVEGVHPGRVVAFGLFNERQGTEDIVLVAEVEPMGKDERADLARKIRSVVAQGTDVAPRHVETVEPGWLIKTSSGKIARGANREKYLNSFVGKD
jgi:acyl-CoA synthetase (AMP-forming)/AMP-acid ligase II